MRHLEFCHFHLPTWNSEYVIPHGHKPPPAQSLPKASFESLGEFHIEKKKEKKKKKGESKKKENDTSNHVLHLWHCNPTAAMSRNGAAALSSGSARRPQWPHLRQMSRTSLDKLSIESPRSPDTFSSNSTLRAESRDNVHTHGSTSRKCTVTINESFARDEVLLNLDLFNSSFRPGMLVSLEVLKPEASKQQSTAAKRMAAQEAARSGATEPAQQSMRYIFVVKDMARELKARYSNVELYVAKQIADVFGMKKGSQVILAPVQWLPSATAMLPAADVSAFR